MNKGSDIVKDLIEVSSDPSDKYVKMSEVMKKAKKAFNFKGKHKSSKGGLTESGRKAYNNATGSNLKRPQPEGGSRRDSYCARSKGQMEMHNVDCREDPKKRICLARKRWKCNKSMVLGNYKKLLKNRCWEGYEPTPGAKAYDKGSCRKIEKSKEPTTWYALHKGEWRGVESIKDNNQPAHEGGGNMYKLEGIPQPVHQNEIEDLVHHSEVESLNKSWGY